MSVELKDSCVTHFINPQSGLDFVRIPAGEFDMGDDVDDDSQPVHRVKLATFWMSRTEVTREQYAKSLAETKRPEPAHFNAPRFNKPEQPVIAVTHDDAAAFCKWASGRLPTEAEWEYAARGSDGRKYPWGNEEPDKSRAVFHQDIGFGATAVVGSLKAGESPFGVLDMAGNVFEWCADWYDANYYTKSPRENPSGPASGEQRVIRGGSWISLPDALRATARGKYPQSSHSVLVGFRVARTSAD